MVCELCGTQSFLQARNETQDAEDMGIDPTRIIHTLKRRVVRRRKRDADGNVIHEPRKREADKQKATKETPKLPPLLDCVLATQMVLDFMARSLVDRVGPGTFPPEEYPKVVKQLWIKFLHTWGVKATRPLLRCYNEFFLYVTREEEEKTDPAVTLNLLEEWDAEWEKKKEEDEQKEQDEDVKEEVDVEEKKEEQDAEEHKERKRKKRKRIVKRAQDYDVLDKFSLVDLLGLLMLASRVLNLGLLPSDFAEWVASGVIPFHNSLATCCADTPDVRDSVKYVAHFFHALMLRHRTTAHYIAFSAQLLQYHMGLRLPPLNVPLAANRICKGLGFPEEVFRNFLWITGFMNAEGDLPELPLLLQAEANSHRRFHPHTKDEEATLSRLLQSEVGIVAHLVVAVKMCANWHEWIYERHYKEVDEEKKDEDDNRPKHKAPPVAAVNEAQLLPRRDLDAFVRFVRQVFVDPERSGIPEVLQEHVEHLKSIEKLGEQQTEVESHKGIKKNNLVAYPAIYINGVLAESDEEIEKRVKRLRDRESVNDSAESDSKDKGNDTFFYPVFFRSQDNIRSALHPAYEHVLEMLCRKIDSPIGSVLPLLSKLDQRMMHLTFHFEHTPFHVNFVEKGRNEWKAAKKAAVIIDAASGRTVRVPMPEESKHDEN
ncbi:unnamed protein product [Phytophthora lilii]|uniref:Unnamed protein product n=1 Tax=Phytophthora lilii TaxID=2077276 RepID=A0A9W6X5D5_9STRA|nr:unnamed protein product [Phytophthora lilii]